jgi:polar amino acid transport system substrate-binding protein
VVVERGATIMSRLNELGLTHIEAPDNATMLAMVAGKRVAAAALITSVADAMLANDKALAAAVTKLEPPIENKFGYVMLSKQFYAGHTAVAECFWTKMREIRATARHAERVKSYLAEKQE